MVSTSCLVEMSKQQTGLRIDRVLFKQLQRSAPLEKLQSCKRGLVGTKLVLAAMWARPYDRLGLDPRFFHRQSIGSSQLICRTVARSLPDMAESAPNLSGLSQPIVRRSADLLTHYDEGPG